MLLQVISTSPLDSRTIEAAGAHRIQLVSALQIGGLTPPSSIIRRSLECVSIPTNVILRHHNNSFCYTQEQQSLLLEDIDICKQFKPAGVVIGGLTSEKQIDQNFLSNIIKEVGGKMSITFHKASDQTSSIFEIVKILQEKKVDTVLTQGGIKPIGQNLQCLHNLVHESKMNILLGGGISHNNIEDIIKTVEPKQIHIGTCVRKNKYGPVDGESVRQFLKLMEQKK